MGTEQRGKGRREQFGGNLREVGEFGFGDWAGVEFSKWEFFAFVVDLFQWWRMVVRNN